MVLWMVFLGYGPAALFTTARFYWPLMAINKDLCAYIGMPAIASGFCALVTAVMYLLLKAPRKMFLPALIFILDYSLVFSPLYDILNIEGFSAFINPEAAYVQKHCAPMDFVQDGKVYSLGICNLQMDSSGQIDDFSYIYDTSRDIINYNNLTKNNKIIFVNTVRKYFNDNPNEQFESADFTATQYYQNFFDVNFDDANAEGFYRDYGKPPENTKNPYPPMNW